jgi:hypothetical protein
VHVNGVLVPAGLAGAVLRPLLGQIELVVLNDRAPGDVRVRELIEGPVHGIAGREVPEGTRCPTWMVPTVPVRVLLVVPLGHPALELVR